MKLRPFAALRPPQSLAAAVAAPPYDVIESDEARVLAEGNPHSFLHVNKPEIDLPPETHPHDDAVYAKAAENFLRFQKNGWLVRDAVPGLYLYRQSFRGHAQAGVVGVCDTGDYERDIIKKHERTLQRKEDDRTRHVAAIQANAGPVFLMVRAQAEMKARMAEIQEGAPEVDFVAADGVRHSVWPIPDPDAFVAWFDALPAAYIADGHHRAASAARCSRDLAAANPKHTGKENYNGFLAVLFPSDDLQVLPYNRLVKGLNGHTPAGLLAGLRAAGFGVDACEEGTPGGRGDIRMFFDGAWHALRAPAADPADPVASLDASIVQQNILSPLLGIHDPRTDARISFKGGYDCVRRLREDVESGKADVAFSLHPTSTDEVMAVSDAGKIMPPKSTWFEPKLRSGLFVHTLDA